MNAITTATTPIPMKGQPSRAKLKLRYRWEATIP
jgi:hypothetical protein